MTRMSSFKIYPSTETTKRRLQTLAVLAHMVNVMCGILSYMVLPYIIFFTPYYWAGLAYLCYMVVDRKAVSRGSRPSLWVRRWVWWRYFRDYFPLKLVKTADLDPSKNYLLCAFPHGVLTAGVVANFATEANNVSQLYPGITHHVTTIYFNLNSPFVRLLLIRLGVCSCSRESLDYLLDSAHGTGRSAVLVVGGAAEIRVCRPGNPRLVLKKRKGFIKMALKHCVSLVPVFSFGENDMYREVIYPEGSWVRWGQEVFRKVTGIFPPVMCGQGFFENSNGLLPLRRPITTVVGKPMTAEHIPEPTQEQIDDLHSRFIEELVALFEEHKHHYLENPENTHLVIE